MFDFIVHFLDLIVKSNESTVNGEIPWGFDHWPTHLLYFSGLFDLLYFSLLIMLMMLLSTQNMSVHLMFGSS